MTGTDQQASYRQVLAVPEFRTLLGGFRGVPDQ
jgi:hypothetical protein